MSTRSEIQSADARPCQSLCVTDDGILRELQEAFSALDAAQIPWLLLRGRAELDGPTGDVDLLVAPGCRARVDRALTGAGFVRVAAAGHGSHRFFFRAPGDGPLVKLDVVDRLDFGPWQQWPTEWAAQVLADRRDSAGVWTPQVGDEAVLHLLHLVLDKGEVSASRLAGAQDAARRATPGSGVAAVADRQFGDQTIRRLVDLVLQGRVDRIPALRSELAATWPRATAARLRIGRRLRRHRPAKVTSGRRRGLVVAVLGPDGSGKTTLLRGLQTDLPIPVRYRYQGLWAESRWDGLFRRIPGARSARTIGRILAGRCAATHHRSLGRIVLMDRTGHDALLPGQSDRSLGGRLIRAAARRFSPAIDLPIVLDVPGEEMFRRKREHSPEQLERWRQAYRAIAADLPGAVVLDATRTPEQVRAEAARLIWQAVTGETR